MRGGEAQRIRLATQIGSQLVGVLYILDEPSIGLHQRDNVRLIEALKNLKDVGNSVLVVEHDKDMILAADYVIRYWSWCWSTWRKSNCSKATPNEMLKFNTITADYITGKRNRSSKRSKKRKWKKFSFKGLHRT